jgi:hypothetical protein
VIQVHIEKAQTALRCARIRAVGEERIENLKEVPPVAKTS